MEKSDNTNNEGHRDMGPRTECGGWKNSRYILTVAQSLALLVS